MVRTTAGPRLDPDLPAIVLNDLLTDCQTNSVARVFGPGVEALEDDKNILRVFRRNADPVTAHAEQPLLARFLGLHGNRWRFFPAKLDRVPDQILDTTFGLVPEQNPLPPLLTYRLFRITTLAWVEVPCAWIVKETWSFTQSGVVPAVYVVGHPLAGPFAPTSNAQRCHRRMTSECD